MCHGVMLVQRELLHELKKGILKTSERQLEGERSFWREQSCSSLPILSVHNVGRIRELWAHVGSVCSVTRPT